MIRLPLSIPYPRWLHSDFEQLYNKLLPIVLVAGTISAGVGLAYILVDISPQFALLGLLVIPAGILVVTRPDLALLLIIFGIPFEDFNEIGGGLSVIKLLSIVVFGGATVHFLIFRRRDSLVGAPQNWLIVFFLLAVILANFVAIDPLRSLEKTFKLLRILVFYLVVINMIRTEKGLKRLIWVFLIAGFLSALYGVFNPEQTDRVSGTMDHPNAFAAAMAMRLPLLLSLLVVEKNYLKKLLLIGMGGIMTYGIALSGSRGGLLAMGLGLLLFAILQKRRIFWLVLVTAIALAGIVVMPLEMKKRVGLVEAHASEQLGNSTDRRETYQVYGWELWQQNPVLGIGFDGFATAYTVSEYRFLQSTQQLRVAHNTYLEILAGTGLVGMIPFLALLVFSVFNNWKLIGYRERYPYLGSVAVGLLAAQGAHFLSILFASKQYDKTLWLLIALVVVLQIVVNAAERKRLSLTKLNEYKVQI